MKWTRSDQRDSVTLAWILGSGRFNQARAFNNPEVLDLVVVHKVQSRLTYNFEALLGYETHVPDLGTAWWAGAAPS